MSNNRMLPVPFIASSLGPLTDGIGSLPVGLQPIEITGAEVVPVGDNPRNMGVKLLLKVFDGPNAGATGQKTINLGHESEKTRKFAEEEFAKILHCVGLGNQPIQDLGILTGKRFVGFVDYQKDPNPHKYTEIRSVETVTGDRPYYADGGKGKGYLVVGAPPVRVPAEVPTNTGGAAWDAPKDPTPAPAQPAPAVAAPAVQAPAQGNWNSTPASSTPSATPAAGAWGGSTQTAPSGAWGRP